MKLLACALNDLPEFRQLLTAIDGGACPAAVSGLAAVHRAHFAAALGLVTGRPVVAVCADEGEAGRLARDMAAFAGAEVPVLAPGPSPSTPGPRCPASGSTGGWLCWTA